MSPDVRSPSRLLAIVVAGALGAVLGGAVVAAVIALGVVDLGDRDRGQLVSVRPPNRDLEERAWCVEFHHFCLVRLADGEVVAFYTYETHVHSRALGCRVEWSDEPRVPVEAVADGGFVGACSGSAWTRQGGPVFGPAPRALDRFPVTVVDPGTPDGAAAVEVDTRRLICGETHRGATERCDFAPRID